MPLTAKGEDIKSALTKEYGAEKGEEVLYAGKNKGTFKGIDSATISRIADAIDGLSRRFDAMCARKDEVETYIVQMDAKDGGKLLRNQTYRVEATSKSDAESKARKKCESLGLTPDQIKSARQE